MMSVDLPLPETPVTQVKVPSGIAASTFCRLFAVAPRMRISWPGWPSRRRRGTSVWRKPDRTSVVKGKSGSVRVHQGGGRIKKNEDITTLTDYLKLID